MELFVCLKTASFDIIVYAWNRLATMNILTASPQPTTSQLGTDCLLPQHWAFLIDQAERPNPLSPREGKLLKLVPMEQKLPRLQMVENLKVAVSGRLRKDSPHLLILTWSAGESPEPKAHLVFKINKEPQ